jgi:beta-N-acetylhexosaminidase
MGLPEFSSWRTDHLVMADALGVQAVKKWYAEQEGQPEFPNRSVVKDALLAGNDLLPLVEFYTDPDHSGWKDYQLPLIQDSILYMRQQYASDPDFRRRADDAVRHIIEAKATLYPRLTREQAHVDPERAAAAAGTHTGEMRSLAESALTLIQPQSVDELRARLPRGPVTPDKVLIVECWEDCYPYRIMPKLELQDSLLALYGPSGSGRLQPADVTTISYGDLDAWLSAPRDPATAATGKAVADASWIVLALAEYNPIGRPVSGAAKRLLDAPPVDLRNKNVAAIAYNVPYHLDSTEISKLAAYFAVYSKTDDAIATGWRALFDDVVPKGHSPVSVGGIFYNVADVVQAEPSQSLHLAVYGQDASDVQNARNVALVAGPVVDRNGNPVPDGASVSFTLARDGGVTVTATGKTSDGMASATMALAGRGAYSATAAFAGITAAPLAIHVGDAGAGASTPPPSAPESENATTSSDGRWSPGLLAAAIGGPIAAVALFGAAGALVLSRRRRAVAAMGVAPATGPAPNDAVAIASSPTSPAATAAAVEAPPRLRVDVETRRVYVNGEEARPPLSNEQFKLLAYLHERAGKVVAREELIRNVWPDVHAEGVSEEALDALVRRVRERIVQAGGERSYIATLRGHGFRLDA